MGSIDIKLIFLQTAIVVPTYVTTTTTTILSGSACYIAPATPLAAVKGLIGEAR